MDKTDSISHRVDIAKGIKTIFEEYLDTNKEFFLNDSYRISLDIKPHKADGIYFSNAAWDNERVFQGNKLNHLVVSDFCSISYLSVFENIEYLGFHSGIVDSLEFLGRYKSLKSIFLVVGKNGKDDQERVNKAERELKQILPNCKISVQN
jgi:hypothetical protein